MTYMQREVEKNPILALNRLELEKMSKKQLLEIRATYTKIPMRSNATKKDIVYEIWEYICNTVRAIDMNRKIMGL